MRARDRDHANARRDSVQRCAPKCGEIDIMENIGKEPSINHGSLHLPASGTANDDQLTGMYTLPAARLGDGFHTHLRDRVERLGHQVLRRRQPLRDADARHRDRARLGVQPAVLHHLVECGCGRELPGAPTASTTFPQTMKVDWVRVYQPTHAG
jgi:hypothetical protein